MIIFSPAGPKSPCVTAKVSSFVNMSTLLHWSEVLTAGCYSKVNESKLKSLLRRKVDTFSKNCPQSLLAGFLMFVLIIPVWRHSVVDMFEIQNINCMGMDSIIEINIVKVKSDY